MAKQLCSPCGTALFIYPVALSASSLEGVNSVAQGKELPAPFSWRGHVWLTQQWGCSKAQSSGNGAVSSAASLLQSSVAIPLHNSTCYSCWVRVGRRLLEKRK